MWRKPRVAKLGVGDHLVSDDIRGDHLQEIMLFSLASRAPILISTQ